MDVQPVNQAAILQAGFNLVPDVINQGIARQQATLQNQQLGIENRAKTAELDDDTAFHSDLASVLQNPNAQAYSALMVKHPRYAEKVKGAWEALSKSRQQTDLTMMGSIHAALANGRTDLAASRLKARIAADKASGEDSSDDEEMLAYINSGDPAKIKAAEGLIGSHLAMIAGPEHAATMMDALGKGREGFTLSQGQKRYDWNNNVVAEVAPETQYLVIPEGGKAVPKGSLGTGGGGQTSGGGSASPGAPFDPHQFFKDFVLPHEGGYAAHDANGAPVNMGVNQAANPGVDVKNLSQDQAADIFAQKYASKAATLPPALAGVYADTAYINPARAEQFLKASGGDPNKFMQLRENWMGSLLAKQPEKYQPYAKAWANRNRDLRAYAQSAGGGQSAANDPPGTIYGNSKPTARVLTPQEAVAKNLDPKKVYEQRPDGTVAAVGDAVGASAPGNPDLQGPEYLADLGRTNRALANQVQAVLDTRAAYPSPSARSAQAQALRAAVLQADPSYDEQAYKRRAETIKQYTPGHTGPGASMLSAATLINHIYELAHAARELPDHSLRVANWASSAYANQTNQPWLLKYNEGVNFVSSELPKFLNGRAPNEGEVVEHKANYSPSRGKSGIQTILATDMDYLFGRYQPLVQAYKDNTGKDLDLDRYAPGKATRAKAAALEYYRENGVLPTVAATPQAAAKLPHGSVFVTGDGRVLKRR